MKKILGSLICVGALVSSVNASQNVGLDVYFDSGYHYNINYKNYNNQNGLVFSGSFEYQGVESGNGLATASAYNADFEGMVGKTLIYKNDDKFDMGVNIMGGGIYRRTHLEISMLGQTAEANGNSFAAKVLLNISGTYNKNVLFSSDLSYATYFGDYDNHIIRYEFGAGYKFTENLYAKANIRFSTIGKNEKHSSTDTLLGFGIGYSF